jgi:glycosyltransferase involved in cell wall biosynthesis
MRILHTNAAYWPFVGGAETYLRAISERLVRDGDVVTVAATDAANVQSYWDPGQPRLPAGESDVDGVQVVRSRVGHLPFSPWSFYLLRRLATDLSRLPADTRPLLDRLAPWMPRVPAFERSLELLQTGSRQGKGRSIRAAPGVGRGSQKADAAGYDLVHGVNIALEWPLIAGLHFARRHGLPFVATPFVHVGEWTVQRFYTMPHQLAALCSADRVIVQTDIEGNELARLGVDPARLVRLGMGVDVQKARGGDGLRFRSQHGVDGPMVTFMGAITDDKGAVHLLRSMQRLWCDGSRATLVIAGQAVAPNTFERAFDNLPDAHRRQIRRMGLVRGQLKQDMLAATDVMALPSRVDSFGIAYLEAWAYGQPVIGCQAGGVPDVIDDGQDGLLVPYGDPAALASAIGSLLADPDRRQAMGHRGRTKVEAHYTWDRIYQGLRSIYQELCLRQDGATRKLRPCGQGEG